MLTRPDGVRIPGELVESYGHYAIGDRVDVLVDPSGRVDPRPANTVDGAASILLPVPWLLLIAAVLCVPAITTRPEAEAVDGMFRPT